MTSALFHPLAFSARDGAVFFEEHCIPPLRCIAIREHLNAKALDRSQSQRSADAHWAICNQLRAAMTEARRQREACARERRANFTAIPGRAA